MAGIDSSHVVVTGATGGVGMAMCDWLSERGATVYALDRKPVDGIHGTFLEVDVTDPESVAVAAAEVRSFTDRIDGLVAAAGVAEPPNPLEDMTWERWRQTMSVNVDGVFLTVQAFGRMMLEQGSGSIVTIGSMSGNYVVNRPQQQAAYNASKSAVVGFTKSVAAEWASRGVRVNALSPGYIATAMTNARSDLHEGWLADTPVGRMATPQEAAAAAGWLLSDDAAFCIGTELLMDGGYSLW